MPEPIIFIAHQKIKQGKTKEYKKIYQDVGEWMEANKPQTAAHIAYVSEDGTEASVVHIFPHIEAMETHMRNLGDVGMKAYLVDTDITIYWLRGKHPQINGLILVANNEKHFGLVVGLTIENWMKV